MLASFGAGRDVVFVYSSETRHCSTRRQKKHLKAPVFPPSSASLISAPRGKRCLATDVSRAPFKGWRRGFEVSLIARVEPAKRATAVSSRAAEMGGAAAASGRRPTQSPTPLEGAIASASEEAVWTARLFQDMKGDGRSCRPPECFKAVAAASPHVQTANSRFVVVVVVISVALFWPASNITDSTQESSAGRLRIEQDW